MRPNEFKLRQKDMGKSLPIHQRTKVKELLAQGFSKKAICLVFNCTYAQLKECR